MIVTIFYVIQHQGVHILTGRQTQGPFGNARLVYNQKADFILIMFVSNEWFSAASESTCTVQVLARLLSFLHQPHSTTCSPQPRGFAWVVPSAVLCCVEEAFNSLHFLK